MRQVHRAGEKAFVDFSGQRPVLCDPQTGELVPVELFIGVLGASNYTYGEACLRQDLPSWISAHVRMLEYFQGSPAIVVPDNLRSGVTQPCRYEPMINRTYLELARHYGLAVVPARKRAPPRQSSRGSGRPGRPALDPRRPPPPSLLPPR
jgi:transposase